MRLPKLILLVLGGIAIGASALSLRNPAGDVAAPHALLEGARIDSETMAILSRACQNCHSDRTEWPWYSHIPPASAMIHADVTQARERFNLSHWESYSPAEKQAILSAIGVVVRIGVMPPGRYALLHPGSRLSALERDRVHRWTRAERTRLSGTIR